MLWSGRMHIYTGSLIVWVFSSGPIRIAWWNCAGISSQILVKWYSSKQCYDLPIAIHVYRVCNCLKSKSNVAENHKTKLKDCKIVWYTEYITVIILMFLLSNCTLNTILTEFHLLQHVFVLQTTDFLAK